MVPNPIKIDDLGVALFLETPIWFEWQKFASQNLSGVSFLGERRRTKIRVATLLPPWPIPGKSPGA